MKSEGSYWTPFYEKQFNSVMLMYELTKKQSAWTKTKKVISKVHIFGLTLSENLNNNHPT